MQTAISTIVPIFNEEQTVAQVIETLLKNNLINEVICVNDGSTDNSLAILKKYKDKIKLINFKKNHGKGYALVKGIKSAKNEIVAFIDADLTNLSNEHIKALFEPILAGKFKAVLGYPSKGWMPDPFSNLTGERVYYKNDLIPHLEKMAKTRFGIEIFLNNLFTEEETKKLPLKQLRGLYKYEKHDSITGLKELLGEAVEIVQEIGRQESLLPEDKQIIVSLVNVLNFKELNRKVKNIKNMQVKQFLEKYVLSYVKKL